MWLALAGCDQEPVRTVGTPAPDAGPTVVTVVPGGPTTPSDPGCLSAPVGPDGATLDADDAVLEIGPGTFDEVVIVELCRTSAPDARPLSEGWDVRIAPPTELRVPMWVSVRAEAAPSGAAFVPAADGTRVRSLEAGHPETGWWTAPTWRAGVVSIAVDDRVLAPFAGRATTADILLLVDNSCSTLDEQQKLADRLPAHLLDVLDAGLVDYHVAVVATDHAEGEHAGALTTSTAGTRWVEPTTPDRDDVLAELVSVGNTGAYDQQGLATVSAALAYDGDANDDPSGQQAWFLRDGAALVVVTVSHRDDHSPLWPEEVAAQILEMSSTRPSVAFHSLVETTGPDRGTKYIAVSNHVGGYVADLMQADWDRFFEEIAYDLAKHGGMPLPTTEVPELWLTFGGRAEPVQVPVIWEDGILYGVEVVPEGTEIWVLYASSLP